jgi:hypothetical protein
LEALYLLPYGRLRVRIDFVVFKALLQQPSFKSSYLIVISAPVMTLIAFHQGLQVRW